MEVWQRLCIIYLSALRWGNQRGALCLTGVYLLHSNTRSWGRMHRSMYVWLLLIRTSSHDELDVPFRLNLYRWKSKLVQSYVNCINYTQQHLFCVFLEIKRKSFHTNEINKTSTFIYPLTHFQPPADRWQIIGKIKINEGKSITNIDPSM